ncbi:MULTISPECIES: IclR family transcriptional regulator [Bacillus]|uniref:IclR family acetate operon transcriptional repressor n=1 Tax=Bacillus capparidis TaxID=1840411 RepID=A0ABS4D2V8_9BACI|nr:MULTISPECIES: IclR family transcriptional regulator [Bacillus]MBP1083959.1 IclR family acetate operon transcriptional repressor [Bacillus capparidis]MED1096992.1 IclR family transcriptional regulator [Bacillus capparidis]
MPVTEGVNSVVHAIRILEQFKNGAGLSAGEISKLTGIPRATVYRLLKTLSLQQIVRQGDDKKYRLTLRLMELGNAALAIPSLQQTVYPFLVSLSDITGETGHFSVLDGYHVGYIAKKESPHPFRMLSYIGWRGPLHATAAGKMLLSYSNSDFIDSVLDQKLHQYTSHTITDPDRLRQEIENIRSSKYAIDDEELSEGLLCFSVPVFFEEKAIGSLSVSGPKQRLLQKTTDEFIEILNQKSEGITKKLMYGIK